MIYYEIALKALIGLYVLMILHDFIYLLQHKVVPESYPVVFRLMVFITLCIGFIKLLTQ